MKRLDEHTIECSSIVAMEDTKARRTVYEFAADLFRDQLETWNHHVATGQRNKSRPPSWDECLAKSREVRIKVERDQKTIDPR